MAFCCVKDYSKKKAKQELQWNVPLVPGKTLSFKSAHFLVDPVFYTVEFEAEHLWNEYFQYMLIQNVLQAKKVQQLWAPQVLVGCQYKAVGIQQTLTAESMAFHTHQIWEALCRSALPGVTGRNTAGSPLKPKLTAGPTEYIRGDTQLKNHN